MLLEIFQADKCGCLRGGITVIFPSKCTTLFEFLKLSTCITLIKIRVPFKEGKGKSFGFICNVLFQRERGRKTDVNGG